MSPRTCLLRENTTGRAWSPHAKGMTMVEVNLLTCIEVVSDSYAVDKSTIAMLPTRQFRRNTHLLGPWRLPISPRDHVWTPNHKPYATAVASPKRALKASMSLETKEKLPLGSHTTMDYLTLFVFQKMMMRIDSYGTPLPYTLTCWGGTYCTRKELFASFNGKLCKETCD